MIPFTGLTLQHICNVTSMDLDFLRQMSLSQAWTLISHVKCHCHKHGPWFPTSNVIVTSMDLDFPSQMSLSQAWTLISPCQMSLSQAWTLISYVKCHCHKHGPWFPTSNVIVTSMDLDFLRQMSLSQAWILISPCQMSLSQAWTLISYVKCHCHKHGPWFPTSNVMVFFGRWLFFLLINWLNWWPSLFILSFDHCLVTTCIKIF